MSKVVVIGEILVEIMADLPGEGFREAMSLTGPFPSGAPAIFIDQVARLGQPCAIVSAVGDDDFGRLNLARLAGDGVDVSAVLVDAERPTGSAFVRYREDGSRDFVFNIRHSAFGRVPQTAAASRVLAEAGHLHVMGSSLSSADFVTLNLEAARAVKSRGGSVSFDPNGRKEMLDRPGTREAMLAMLSLTDIFLPSGPELTLLTGQADEAAALAALFDRGVSLIVHKLGADGLRYHDRAGSKSLSAYRVSERDPTGAGDCFGGAFIALWLQHRAPEEALRFAAAAGARAVLHRGPMEGASTLLELEAFMAAHAPLVPHAYP